ncbi:hypothetical protein MLD38_027986 [Melastoma candidum]|uniref:Uncharacterized protein n=1 Tax=Melastoma candidum TaxID=119954 RepID=A0ACB9MZT1_9MYRT|nr:hypothetical protein MLD38_027986 [Melastoma candidum]
MKTHDVLRNDNGVGRGSLLPVFEYLDSLEVEDSKDVKSGYSITLNFRPIPYFEDTKLVKTFTFLDEGSTKVTATSIKWKEGMGLPNGVTHEKKGNKRPINDKSFFQWYTDNQKEGLEDKTDEIAEIIKEDLWPNPLSYFNNDADEVDDDEDETKHGHDGFEVDDDDEDEDEEEDGEEEDGEEDDGK